MAADVVADGPLARLGADPRDPDAALQAVRLAKEVAQAFAPGSFDLVHEFRAIGPIPYYTIHGYADHGKLRDCFEPIEFGSFFVSYSK
jgi:hypothetical protein